CNVVSTDIRRSLNSASVSSKSYLTVRVPCTTTPKKGDRASTRSHAVLCCTVLLRVAGLLDLAVLGQVLDLDLTLQFLAPRAHRLNGLDGNTDLVEVRSLAEHPHDLGSVADQHIDHDGLTGLRIELRLPLLVGRLTVLPTTGHRHGLRQRLDRLLVFLSRLDSLVLGPEPPVVDERVGSVVGTPTTRRGDRGGSLRLGNLEHEWCLSQIGMLAQFYHDRP